MYTVVLLANGKEFRWTTVAKDYLDCWRKAKRVARESLGFKRPRLVEISKTETFRRK